MKRIILVVLSISLLLCGCGAGNNNATEEPPKDLGIYSDIVSEFRELVEYRLSPDFEEKWNSDGFPDSIGFSEDMLKEGEHTNGYSNMIVEMLGYPWATSISDYGYKLFDLNGDGIDELFFVRKDVGVEDDDSVRDEDFILAILTVSDGKVKLIDAFWSRYKAAIIEGSKIYTMSSGGIDYLYNGIATIKDGKYSYEFSFGIDGFDKEKNMPLYYKGNNGTPEWITEEEFGKIAEQYPFEYGAEWKSVPLTLFK
ncbi:MAG: hypothetical protein IKL62_00145 [Clostridia bacterium]|nr:hypothetical protein [Clostridia bacterium]